MQPLSLVSIRIMCKGLFLHKLGGGKYLTVALVSYFIQNRILSYESILPSDCDLNLRPLHPMTRLLESAAVYWCV